MKKCIVFGTSYFAEMLTYYVEKFTECEVVAYTVDKEYRKGEELYGKNFVDFETVQELYPPTEYSMVVGLGYNNMNELRKNKFTEIKEKFKTQPVQWTTRLKALVQQNCKIKISLV